MLLLLFTAVGFFFQNQILAGVIQYAFSICLFINLMQCREKRMERYEDSVGEALLSFMGQNSFALYLWHVIGKSVGLMITGNHYNITYYAFVSHGLLCFVLI